MTNVIFELEPAEAALCRAIAADSSISRPAARDFIDTLGNEPAFQFARSHEVASHVGHALGEDPQASEVDPRWAREHDQWERRISRYLTELDHVASALDHENIPLVALKNVGIARGLHPCAGCCPMGDIDVLVAQADFPRAHDILLQLGYRFEFRSPLEECEFLAAATTGSAEYCRILETGEELWLELQWRPVAGRWIQPDQEPRAVDLIARSLPIQGSHARLLSPEDNLLQVALHTAKHSYVRAPGLRLHTDVDRIVRAQSLDWDRFLALTTSLHVRTATYYSLQIPRQICGTPIPSEVCERLAPPKLQRRQIARLMRRAGLFHPNESKFSRLEYIVFTSLLYDDLRSWRRAILPRRQWMRERYGEHATWQLPWLHVRRIADLLFRRMST